MAERIITGTLTVNFSRAEDEAGAGNIIIEVDDRDDGLNGGKTTFRPGDPVFYLVYLPPGATVIEHVVTAGSRSGAGSGNRSVEQLLPFANSDSATLRYPAGGSASLSWMGRNAGTPTLQADKQTITLPAPGIGILRASYAAPYTAYRLGGVDESIEQVLIAMTARVVT